MEQKTLKTKEHKAPFDPAVCFTCFGPWVESIRDIGERQGADAALAAFLSLADYCLYNIEPDSASNPWNFAWPLVKRQAQNSMNNRRRGFGAENSKQTLAIQDYFRTHPEATYKEVSEALGCSIGKAHKVIKPIRDGALSSSDGVCTSSIHSDSSSESDSIPLDTYSPEGRIQDAPQTVNADSAEVPHA